MNNFVTQIGSQDLGLRAVIKYDEENEVYGVLVGPLDEQFGPADEWVGEADTLSEARRIAFEYFEECYG